MTAGITAGLVGFSTWGPDIQSMSSSKELWVRWVQFGALTPVMRDHLWTTPKFSVDLWFDRETIDTFRRYARLHVSLFPYFYSYARQALDTGLPVMRHLMLEWPEDPKTWEAEHQYLIGDKVLVAPVVTEGSRSRSLYLPKGEWTNFWTGEILEGGRSLSVNAPLNQIPLLVRAGSVIPLIDPDVTALATDLGSSDHEPGSHLIWRIFPASKPTTDRFTLYDGTQVIADTGSRMIQVTCGRSRKVRDYEIIVPSSEETKYVELSGQVLAKVNQNGSRGGKRGWWLKSDDRTLHVAFATDNFVIKVRE